MAQVSSSCLSVPGVATAIFIPGAWHSPSCYDPVIERLRSSAETGTPYRTYNIVKVVLPSICCPRSSMPMDSCRPDIEAVLLALDAEISKKTHGGENESEINTNNKILVISHSYGSLVANEALGSFLLAHPHISSKVNLQHLILCGFITDIGGAIRDRASTVPYPGLWDVRGNIVYPSADAAEWFYHDLSESQQHKLMKDLEGKYMPLASFTSPTQFAAWKDVPTTYLYCENDRTIPMSKQESMVSRAKQAGGLIQSARATSGHSPFLVVPEKVAACIRSLI